ncbi:efflux RND transporter periplasmic adaptor subunit [Muricauda sp. 2012CJ35-5]|uniref:Efflux RND transporter periplasmic adaptor subunit n=1 Tax=Flagellimonas spongiicola TaxID=2942208 RepID=A0ABT0PNE5_9FLAO|nr:efflux RND transporter periplasmic adaptor subunit [Allomuricauda spongiicola]MCL6272898.1 efflux RND transporter periplasmic adaptor subunit [Allomuricauda spongiicola]
MKLQLAPIKYLFIGLLISSCGNQPEEQKVVLRPVKYNTVGFIGGENTRSFSGTAQTDKIINLSFRASGILTQMDIKLGQQVKKGQLLAKLDNVQSRLAYEQSLTDLNSAASQMNTAKLSLNRVRSLYEKGSSSLSDFEAAKNSYNTAQESHKSAKRGVQIQQEQIQFGYIYAPEDGIIASVTAELDENVQAGQAIGVLNAGADMQITLGIPESVINRVKENSKVSIGLSALEGVQFDGVVTEVAPALDSNTATYPVKVTVTNPTDDIKSGMAANVMFNFDDEGSGAKSLVVPTQAVGEDSQGRFVFLLESEGEKVVVKKQHISIGELSLEGFEVTSGLTAGQNIATAGLQTLLDGQEVRLQQP